MGADACDCVALEFGLVAGFVGALEAAMLGPGFDAEVFGITWLRALGRRDEGTEAMEAEHLAVAAQPHRVRKKAWERFF